MAHKDSKWPKTETAKEIKKEDSDRFCEIFNSGEWETLNKSRFFKLKYYNPKDTVKETVFNANKNRHEEINRFRNGHLTQCPTSVDIEKLVRVGSVISKLFEGFICDNLEFTPFEKFVIKMTEKINKNKKEKKDLLQTSTKSKTNAGFCLRAEINDSFKCVSTQWMKIEYNDRG